MMIASLKRHDLYEVFIGLGEDSYKCENYWLNECDAKFGTMTLALSRSLCYLNRSIEFPKDLWTKPLERLMRIIIALWRAHPAP